MRNLVPTGVGSKLDQAHQLLTQAVYYLQAISDNTTPKQTAARRERSLLTLSQVQTRRDSIYPRNVVLAILIGGDTAGRGSINWGGDNLPIWIGAGLNQFLQFTGGGDALEIPGGSQISYTPPANTTLWDVTLFLESGGPTR